MVKEYKSIADYRDDLKPKHNPAPPLDTITFRKINILGKDVYVSPKSKLVVALKKPKKSAETVSVFDSSHVKEAVDFYKKVANDKTRKLGHNYFLLVHTDDLDHECVVQQTF